MTETCEQLVAKLEQETEAVLAGLLPRGTRCAVVNFPDHENAGDSAIWVGMKRVFSRIGVEVALACETQTYSPDAITAAVGDGPVLIAGGGNLGDLWAEPQALRERVLQDFRGTRVVELPQSIYFRDAENRARYAQLLRDHGHVVLIVREQQSLAAAVDLDAEVLLCPDLAFSAGPLAYEQPAATQVFWLGRTDRESLFPELTVTGNDVERVDWVGPPPEELDAEFRDAHAKSVGLSAALASDPGANELRRELGKLWDELAERRLERGCRLLLRGRVVVSDRLHAHVLSVLLGLPHVLLDNSYGKVRSVYETWTSDCKLAHWADSPEEAFALARELF